MANFVQPSFPTHHKGVERMSDGIESATTIFHKATGALSIATILLAAVVSALVVAANQLIDTWADGHLLAAWAALWVVTFTAIALAANPIHRTVLSIKQFDGKDFYTAWSARRKARINDDSMWNYAKHDDRQMADILCAVDNTPDATKSHLRD